jgi:hypothetical protein
MLDERGEQMSGGAPAVDSGVVIKFQIFVKFVFFSPCATTTLALALSKTNHRNQNKRISMHNVDYR